MHACACSLVCVCVMLGTCKGSLPATFSLREKEACHALPAPSKEKDRLGQTSSRVKRAASTPTFKGLRTFREGQHVVCRQLRRLQQASFSYDGWATSNVLPRRRKIHSDIHNFGPENLAFRFHYPGPLPEAWHMCCSAEHTCNAIRENELRLSASPSSTCSGVTIQRCKAPQAAHAVTQDYSTFYMRCTTLAE